MSVWRNGDRDKKIYGKKKENRVVEMKVRNRADKEGGRGEAAGKREV